MGSERYGIVVLAATISSLPFVDAGAGLAVMRAVPWHRARGDEAHARRLAGSGLLLSVVGGALVGAAIWVVAPDIADALRLTHGQRPVAVAACHVVAFTTPAVVAAGLLGAVLRAAGHFPATAISSALTMIGLNVVWASVAGLSDDVLLVVRVQLLIVALTLLWMLGVIWFRARGYLFPVRPSISASRELLSFGGKSSIGSGSLLLLFRADKLVLATVLPVSVLPAYAIPFSIALRITVVSQALGGVLLPRLSAISGRGDLAEMRRVGLAA